MGVRKKKKKWQTDLNNKTKNKTDKQTRSKEENQKIQLMYYEVGSATRGS